MIQALKNEVLNWQELIDLIDQRAALKFNTLAREQRLTREQMSSLFQVSKDTIDNLSEEELAGLGWKKIKVGSLVRFEKTSVKDNTREALMKVKKNRA